MKKTTQVIEMCPNCGVFGLANGVCDYCHYVVPIFNIRLTPEEQLDVTREL